MLKILSVVSYNLYPPRSGGQKGILIFTRYLATVSNLVVVTVKSNEPHFEKGFTMLNILSNAPSRYLNVGTFFRLKKIIPISDMPWDQFRNMSDNDIKAIYKYLVSLKPVKNVTGPTYVSAMTAKK